MSIAVLTRLNGSLPLLLPQALSLVSDWTAAEREYLRTEVTRFGLRTPFRGATVQDVAKQVGGVGDKQGWEVPSTGIWTGRGASRLQTGPVR